MAERQTEKKKAKNSATLGDIFRSLRELVSVSWKSHQKKRRRAQKKKLEERRLKPQLTKKQLLRRRKKRNRVIRRVCLCVVTALALIVGALAAVLGTVFYGPSRTASDQLVNSLLETSALKFVPRLYFSKEQVEEIVARNAVIVPEEKTDTSLVVVSAKSDDPGQDPEEIRDIELVEVKGPTYKGYMLIVRDPSRVKVGVCHNPFKERYGKFLDEIAEEENAVAAINAGGFEDDNGSGKGGIPIGVVYKDGVQLWSETDTYYDTLIGFNYDDKLIIATGLSGHQSRELNLRDGVTFGPALVVNGEAAVIKGSSSGLNPRTAIGQRADGAVLMLVIDGRQPNSLGASLSDLISIMLEYGAVNAANLDGGSSSKLYYQGKFINDGVAVTGSRRLATAFIVK
ncbi:MAG: phosphodiester glycosidase family protein [Clostridia bacterium]|nr:phosphodiester glycosidase family protein [Clostridia bacterium]MBO4886034.1 phosphodiester glycosidase family protein [Clostridia bacterium]MBR4443385.1 phosphodiester glycosidase family protein [Clostridia bacterium]